MLPFNKPHFVGTEPTFIAKTFTNQSIAGDGIFGKKIESQLQEYLGTARVLLTTSCTHALEMSAILLNLQPGDEIIVPSFTFVSTALAFTQHGAKPVFADIRADTLNIDETKIESLVTSKTRAVVVVHYAGVSCEMDYITELCQRHSLMLIEDNAHGLYGKYKGQYLGTFGTFATQSFHETKNFTCGEGGALLINDSYYIERAEIIREKGTNRTRFFRGQIDKYTWIDKGSSYVLSDILAAFLFAQLSQAEKIQRRRKEIWDYYRTHLTAWAMTNQIQLPTIPEYCQQAYHMFYLLMPSLESRTKFINHLKSHQIQAVFHYSPLHQADMAMKLTKQPYDCSVATDTSSRLVRLPFFYDLSEQMLQKVIQAIINF